MPQQDFTARELAFLRYKIIGDTYRDSWAGDKSDAQQLVHDCHVKLLKAIANANASVAPAPPTPPPAPAAPLSRADKIMQIIRDTC